MKMTKSQALQIHAEAEAAAKIAANEYHLKHGEAWPCGFAWVFIESGRGTFAKTLREAGIATRHYSGRGLHVHSPAKYPTQNIETHIAGAAAYANVLRSYNIKARPESRID